MSGRRRSFDRRRGTMPEMARSNGFSRLTELIRTPRDATENTFWGRALARRCQKRRLFPVIQSISRSAVWCKNLMKASAKLVAIVSVFGGLSFALALPAQTVGTAAPLSPVSSGLHADDRAATDASSTYVELDSWVYPALERLGAQGVIPYEFLGLRPWTRRAIYQMLAHTQGTEVQEQLVHAIEKELFRDVALGSDGVGKDIFLESVYSRSQFISGAPLNDSYHFGQTLADDFGRPYGQGWQQITGFETRAEHGRFSLFVRGEYQRSPSVPGYSAALAGIIATQDNNPIQTYSNQPAGNVFRLLDSYASVELFLGQQFSFGKQS